MKSSSLHKLFLSPSFSLLMAVLLGIFLPAGAKYFSWAGYIFISLLKLLVLPLVFISCFYALSKNSLTQTLSLGKKTFLFYLLTSALAALAGISFAYIFLKGNIDSLPKFQQINPSFELSLFIAKFIPKNIFLSFSEGNILHIVFVAIFSGLMSQFIPQKQILVDISESINMLLMKMLSFVIKLAPIGIIGLVYPAVANLDSQAIFALGNFSLAVGGASIVHGVIVLPAILYLVTRRNPLGFFLNVRSALAVALSTASSSATYPVTKSVLENNENVEDKVTGFSLPLGATLNMDGSAVYQAILLIFMTHLAGITLLPWQVFFVFIMTMLSSAGTAGVPGGGIAMMAFMLDLLGLPTAYLGLYLLVDKFFDYPVTAMNVWGDLIIAKCLTKKSNQ